MIDRALAKEEDDRHASAEELAAIADEIGLEEIAPEWLGASIVIRTV